MGFFDFLFGNSKKVKERQEQLRLQQQEADEKRRAEEQRRQAEARKREEEARRHAEEQRKLEEERTRLNQIDKAYLAIFSASWCGPSKRFLKEIQSAGINNYTLIDVDKDGALSEKYSIISVPTTLLLDCDGNVLKKWIGYDDEDPGQSKFVNFIKNASFDIYPYAESSSIEAQQKTENVKNEEKVVANTSSSISEAKVKKPIQKPKTNVATFDEVHSDYLDHLAGQSNFALNSGNESAAIKLMNELFDACYGREGHRLLQISDQAAQPIGLAFSNIALFLNFNDEDMNSVAAENAVYCLGRSIIAKSNTYCAPAIFTIMNERRNLLKDKLIATHCEISQRRVGMNIVMMLGGNPFTAPHLNEFRDQAINEKGIEIMAYLLSLFYEDGSYTVPEDMPYNIPSRDTIQKFISKKKSLGFSEDDILREGEEYFYELFNQCQETLLKLR